MDKNNIPTKNHAHHAIGANHNNRLFNILQVDNN